MTVLELIQESTKYLAGKGVESPRLQIELLLSHVLKLPRLQLYMQFDRPLEASTLDQLRPMVRARSQRVPLQHIMGTTSFCGLELECSAAALIPRQETELLIELCVQSLAGIDSPTIIDVGTGTGAIALALGARLPSAKITALDISPEALVLARRNHEKHPQPPIDFRPGNLLEGLTEKVDLVVANLPYLFSSDMAGLSPEVKHDPALALDGGSDGLDLIRQLIPQAARLTQHLALEIDPRQADPLQPLLAEHGFTEIVVQADLTQRPRYITTRHA